MEGYTKTHRILRLILCLSTGFPRTKEECQEFLGVKDTAFYNYCNLLRDNGFNLQQKDGRYWIDCSIPDSRVLLNILHFSEEELYLLARSIDVLDDGSEIAVSLRKKLISFLNQDKVIEKYLSKHKSAKVLSIRDAVKKKLQVLFIDYASGSSETVRNRMVEPFEFSSDFELVWAFDVDLKQNRQFKVSRIGDIAETPLRWEYESFHQSKPVDIFRNTGDLDKMVRLRLNIKARNLMIEEYPLSRKYMARIKENRFELRARVARYEGPARFVMGLSDSINVLGDDGFLDFLRSKRKNF